MTGDLALLLEKCAIGALRVWMGITLASAHGAHAPRRQ
jgi:hypothetical protein